MSSGSHLRQVPPSSAVLAVVALSGLLACSPAGPSGRPTSLVVSGPSEVSPGGTGRFTAAARYQDGSWFDVTNEAWWDSAGWRALRLEPGGVATGVFAGDAAVRARFEGAGKVVPVIVTPTGTYSLTVNVVDADFPGDALREARVEGVGSNGIALPTELTYPFRLFGLVGPVELTTSLPPMYEPDVRILDVNAHQEVTVQLRISAVPPVAVGGAYRLTLTAAASCAGLLPDEGMTRSYDAMVDQGRRGDVVVTLDGATFGSVEGKVGNSIAGNIVDVDHVQLAIIDYRGLGIPEHFVVETLSGPGHTMIPVGTVLGRIGSTGISGPFDGSIEIWNGDQVARCQAPDHLFTMTRQ